MQKIIVPLLNNHDFENVIGNIEINIKDEYKKDFFERFCKIGNGIGLAPGYIVKSRDQKNMNIITEVELLEISICKVK